ncbi:MAG: hypothetical protein ACF8QF_05285 [Phycisphaerales bacterium]
MDRRRLVVLLIWTVAWSFGAVARSGPLTPPGAPAPSMKTLNEVEARIPVGPLTTPGDSSCTYRITQPGSYYLTGNVHGAAGKSGIIIASGFVTLDLNGYAIVGVSGSLHGVTTPTSTTQYSIQISNGVIGSWDGSGVSGFIVDAVVRDLRIYGCGRWGIDLNSGYLTRVERCSIFNAGYAGSTIGGGIQTHGPALIDGCLVQNGVGVGINGGGIVRGCIVTNVYVDSGAGQTGIGINGTQVEASQATWCAGTGITAVRVIRECVSLYNGAAYSAPYVVSCY